MEAIGLLDALTAIINDCPKAPFSRTKIVVDEHKILALLAKLKLLIQTDGAAAGTATVLADAPRVTRPAADPKSFGIEGEALLRQAQEEAGNTRRAADDYARNVLTNLQIVVNKMLRNLDGGKVQGQDLYVSLNKMLSNLEIGKERLNKYREEDKYASG